LSATFYLLPSYYFVRLYGCKVTGCGLDTCCRRQASGIQRRVVSLKYTDVSHIALMVTSVRTSETSVYFDETTRRYIPEGCQPEISHGHLLFSSCYDVQTGCYPVSIGSVFPQVKPLSLKLTICVQFRGQCVNLHVQSRYTPIWRGA
jgi:hypothetical protein